MKIKLPTTTKAFDILVSKLMKMYKFKNRDHVASIVANRIQHMPADEDSTSTEYLAKCINKNMAYQVAVHKAKEINHQSQIDSLMGILKATPGDQQALDAINAAITDGSEYAKEALASLQSTH